LKEEDIIGKVGVYLMMKKVNNDTSKNSSKYTEDWLPVKQIMNGMIQTDDGYYVTGVKVMPKNIFMLEKTQQQNIIYNLRNFYNMIDYEFWLIVADRPVDINVYLANLQLQYNRNADSVSRKLIMQDINKANSFMSSEYDVVDTEYYVLFKEKKLEIVQKRIHSLISGFAGCGLNSLQTSNDDLRMLLDNFFNGGNRTTLGTVMS